MQRWAERGSRKDTDINVAKKHGEYFINIFNFSNNVM